MSEPRISCIVPAYNSARYLGEALDSILAQTRAADEVIVADDGSSDDTVAVAERYGAPVRVVTQATAGPPATRNLGVLAARGDFIAFLDADDRWHPQKLERQMARFAARPELGVSVTRIRHFWIDELADEEARFRNAARGGALPGYVTMTMLARRPLFDSVGLFDPKLWHSDAGDWFLRAAAQGAVIEQLPEVLVDHRMHLGNLSRRYSADSQAEFVHLVKRSLDQRRAGSGAALPLSAFTNEDE